MDTLPVVAAIDGSDDSLRALDWAREAARQRDAPLRVAHVRQYAAWAQPDVLAVGPPDPDDDPVLDEARARLDGATDGPTVEYLPLEGVPAAALPELGLEAQLLVLGSRGRGGFASLLLGSSSLAAARDAECPVVVVPRPGREVHGTEPAGPGPRVVVGLHVDSPDEAALDFAFTEAALRGARLQVVAAYPWPVPGWAAPGQIVPPVIDEVAVESETRVLADGFLAPHRERHPAVTAEPYVVPGDAAGHLVAASAGADLVVVGRHRRRLLAPARMMGSVAHAVLLHAASPVAVIPPSPPED
ncbi:universal stress protein [Streptomyces sp. CRN 30]|uniref:universal stress protein n=1 Tax=Streptomyces sp. CRN 30 TaxID=3075613 RepID=UPI002A7F7054|nr:universal stress protein [Streptomyces sp. CRN 30]